ncbi:MAG TPA: sn-glycerol-3-phosphate ABC transporter ATP-binding protein UgpC [Solirubrobacteraceae bacterium]|jgi:multiple sugar transport system ATP-binding protein|nr:sn-glycerol-3-phosphate ABC transporter ATP-binding protein UgpC [Solirubrobacteraceae bacterium]
MADVVFERVGKVYPNGYRAVDSLSLEIRDGEFLVLVGPSGCGKTTALRMVAGLENISSGDLSIGDQVVNELTPKERDIAMIFQNYALYPHLSVRDNIAFSMKLRKDPKAKIKDRVAWATRMLDLEPYLDRKPKELSGGQRQRVAMGRAIVRHPQVFLMDEPLSNLDAKLRVQMRTDIAKLQNELQTTTMYVTHDQVEAMTMGDRVAVMRSGVLQQVADPQTLYDAPANVFVAGFIGTPAMNLLEATVVVDKDVSIRLASATLPIPNEVLLRDYPKLRLYGDQVVTVGIRSQGLHPAAARPDLPQIAGQVELVEALGGESIVYCKINARAVREGQEDDEGELAEGAEGVVASRPNLVAAFPGHTSVRPGERIDLGIELERMHFFDRTTGLPLR